MRTVTLGKTGLTVAKNGFGALPVQRVSTSEAAYLLQKAFYNGMNFFDTARYYSDSEQKLGEAFRHIRPKLIISTKTGGKDGEGVRQELEESLRMLQTDYIDIYQFHNPATCPRPGDGTGRYEAAMEAKAQGKIRFIGITNHRIAVAEEAIESGLYDTLQFPFSYLASEKEIALVQRTAEKGMGFISMKALAGGLITNAAAAYAYQAQFSNAVPIWGVQRESELDEFISFQSAPPELTEELSAVIAADRKALAGDFCRGCGYCMPCTVDIEISNCARMSLLLHRSPSAKWLTEAWQEKMAKIEDCINCGQCEAKCPYGLHTPELLRRNYEDYKTFLK